MSEITVRPITTKEDTLRFIKFLWKVYKGDPYWVPPLIMDRQKLMDRKKNPFYTHADSEFFIAEQDGVMVGRIAAIVNHNHNKEHQDKVGFFGFFECINDQAVAKALFDTARAFLKQRGMTSMRGPANPSVNDEYGLLVDGFTEHPTILMTYNPPYYMKLIEAYGFKKEKDLYAYFLSQKTVYTDKLERANDIVKKRQNLVFRSLDMKRFSEEVGRIKEVYNKAWEKNWGAVPMTDAEIDALAADLKPIVVPDLVLFAEKEGRTIGFALSLPDINVALKFNRGGHVLPGLYHLFTKKKHINLVRIIVLGVLPEYRSSGAAGVLFYETAQRAKALGYEYGEASWILEDNVAMNRAAEVMQGKITKRYRLYETPI
ncbi:MAG: GNAT family N-acetyltransferase [Ignavibacteriales bacterium]|nr:GNAT family N-acetyltransferase [Ignavibacteriales bacterium]